MRHLQKAVSGLLALNLLGCAATLRVPSMGEAPPGAPVQVIEVSAQKYRFSPGEIRVKRGTVVRLVLRSQDTEHGIKIPGYGIDQDIPRKGQGTVTVEFFAGEPGTYDFYCSNFCGLGHWGMDGKITVEAE